MSGYFVEADFRTLKPDYLALMRFHYRFNVKVWPRNAASLLENMHGKFSCPAWFHIDIFLPVALLHRLDGNVGPILLKHAMRSSSQLGAPRRKLRFQFCQAFDELSGRSCTKGDCVSCHSISSADFRDSAFAGVSLCAAAYRIFGMPRDVSIETGSGVRARQG